MPSVTFTIPAGKYTEFKEAFLKAHSNQETIPDPNFVGNIDDAPQIPKYTDDQWIKEAGLRWYKTIFEKGKSILHREALVKVDAEDYVS